MISKFGSKLEKDCTKNQHMHIHKYWIKKHCPVSQRDSISRLIDPDSAGGDYNTTTPRRNVCANIGHDRTTSFWKLKIKKPKFTKLNEVGRR
jgi:hypothetical protein